MYFFSKVKKYWGYKYAGTCPACAALLFAHLPRRMVLTSDSDFHAWDMSCIDPPAKAAEAPAKKRGSAAALMAKVEKELQELASIDAIAECMILTELTVEVERMIASMSDAEAEAEMTLAEADMTLAQMKAEIEKKLAARPDAAGKSLNELAFLEIKDRLAKAPAAAPAKKRGSAKRSSTKDSAERVPFGTLGNYHSWSNLRTICIQNKGVPDKPPIYEIELERTQTLSLRLTAPWLTGYFPGVWEIENYNFSLAKVSLHPFYDVDYNVYAFSPDGVCVQVITIKPFEHVAPGRYQIEVTRKIHSGTGINSATYCIVVVIMMDSTDAGGGGAKRKRDAQKDAHINVNSETYEPVPAL